MGSPTPPINPYRKVPRNFIQKVSHRLESYTQQPTQIALYHRVGPLAASDNQLNLKITPETFEDHLKTYSKSFNTVFVDDLVRDSFSAAGGNTVAITFDDGYGDNYEFAFPLIKKYNIPITIFLTTHFIESGKFMLCDALYQLSQTDAWPSSDKFSEVVQRLRFLKTEEAEAVMSYRYGMNEESFSESFKREHRSMTWDEMREMQDSGLVRFEPHGHEHINLATLNDREVKYQVETSMQCIKEHLNYEAKVFAYPFGSVFDISPQTPKIIESCGLEAAFLASGRCNTPYTDPYRIDRASCFKSPLLPLS